MLKVYCYSRCTTCKKALKWLEDHGIDIRMKKRFGNTTQ